MYRSGLLRVSQIFSSFSTFFIDKTDPALYTFYNENVLVVGRQEMKKTVVLLRILCTFLDAILIMIPLQFLMMGVFRVPASQADLLYQFLFAVYGALFTEYIGGTPGKYLGKLCCVDVSGAKAPILYTGLRELVKSMYFIPVIGWLAAAVSIVMMTVRKDGRTLHDLAGNTKVICRSAREGEENDSK